MLSMPMIWVFLMNPAGAENIDPGEDGNRIEDNNATDNNRGIDIDITNNLIIPNNANGSTINFDIAVNNKVGVIVVALNSPAISGSTGGVEVSTTNPWSNFSF